MFASILALSLCIPAIASAQTSSADALFEEGVEALRNEDYEGAARAFSESHQLQPRASTLYNLALCWQELGRAAEELRAWRELLGYEISPAARGRAANRIRELEGRPIGAFETANPFEDHAAPEAPLDDGAGGADRPAMLSLSSDVDDTRVSIDDGEAQPLPVTVELPPGEHDLRVTSPDRVPSTQSVTLAAGEQAEISLSPGDRLPACRRRFWHSCWPWIIGGAVLVGVGVTLGVTLPEEEPQPNWTVRGP